MITELFSEAEGQYRRQKLLAEAEAYRFARSVPGRPSRWGAWWQGRRAARRAANRPAPCAG